MELIVAHGNYRGLYYDRDANGEVNWVVTGSSAKGRRRKEWWDAKCVELGIEIQKGCYARVARAVQPTGIHVCQCCGESKSIYYEYPSKRTAEKLNAILGLGIDAGSDEARSEYTISEIVEAWCDTEEKTAAVAGALGLGNIKNKEDLIKMIYSELVWKEDAAFSPGVMSNSPDRFDGFHSYGLCCRSRSDKGRHPGNMHTYTQDRRAYEAWADGNFNLANRLMGEFRKQAPMRCPVCGEVARMTADHIGPVSLGFCHSSNFAPMCKKCNSAKNNRFTRSDVDKLLSLEKQGVRVVSWHSAHIWDLLKYTVRTDSDARFASSVMAKCHQNVLNILSLVFLATGRDFLMRYLHPEYAMTDYRFDNVDLNQLDEMRVIATPVDNKNKHKNRERYVRISFESLADFAGKENRKNYLLHDSTSEELKPILEAIRGGDYDMADSRLRSMIERTAERILEIERAGEAAG